MRIRTINLPTIYGPSTQVPTDPDTGPSVVIWKDDATVANESVDSFTCTVTQQDTGVYFYSYDEDDAFFEVGHSYRPIASLTFGSVTYPWQGESFEVDVMGGDIYDRIGTPAGMSIADDIANVSATVDQQDVADALKLAPTAGSPANGSVYQKLGSETDVLTNTAFEARTLPREEYATVTSILPVDYPITVTLDIHKRPIAMVMASNPTQQLIYHYTGINSVPDAVEKAAV
jgi:hypothetical protein